MIDKVDVPSAPTTAMNKSNLGIIAAKIPVISVYVKFCLLFLSFETKSTKDVSCNTFFNKKQLLKRGEMKFMVALPSWLMSFRLSKLSNLNYSWNYLHFQIVLINNPTNFLFSLSLSLYMLNKYRFYYHSNYTN